jgi:hypothetical protein
VTVGAKAKHVGGDVGPVVASAERTNVGAFGVTSTGDREVRATRLTNVVVELLDVTRHRGRPHNSLNRRGAAARFARALRRLGLIRGADTWLVQLRIERNEPIPADAETLVPRLLPGVHHAKEAVVSQPGKWRKGRTFVCSADDANRCAVETAGQ